MIMFPLIRYGENGLMAKYRETVCKYYICFGQCKKGREAEHKSYCQKCSKYEPRAKVKHKNKKKEYERSARYETESR